MKGRVGICAPRPAGIGGRGAPSPVYGIAAAVIGLIVVVGGPTGATAVTPEVGVAVTEPYMDHEPSLTMPLAPLISVAAGAGMAVGASSIVTLGPAQELVVVVAAAAGVAADVATDRYPVKDPLLE